MKSFLGTLPSTFPSSSRCNVFSTRLSGIPKLVGFGLLLFLWSRSPVPSFVVPVPRPLSRLTLGGKPGGLSGTRLKDPVSFSSEKLFSLSFSVENLVIYLINWN